MEDRMKILLCEDDENLGMLLREYLQAKGYNADLFVDGESGYKAFLKGKYDICVLDVMMPKRTGSLSPRKYAPSTPKYPSYSSLLNRSRKTFSKDSKSVLTTTSPNHSRWKNSYSVSRQSCAVSKEKRQRNNHVQNR